MRKIIIGIIFCVILTGIVYGASSYPSPKGKYVNDFAGILSPAEAGYLRGLFENIDKDTTAEVVFVSVQNTSPLAPSQYRTELFNIWKIGKSDKDNGLLILYAKDEKRIEVETGYGLEGILPDSKLGRLLDENYVPARDSGNLSLGILAFSDEVVNVIMENADEVRSGQTGGNKLTSEEIIAVIFIIYLFSSIILRRIYRNKPKSSLPWFIPIFLPSRRVGGGFGGGSFGGGFGGGMSGGGGAGR